ncbi:MAG: hypothetical protein NTX75_08905 [Proteobacteria bacterium]|nr:hypothetical protein [Pseudomonadota bacterium]
MKNITLLKFRTISEYEGFRDLSYEQLTSFSTIIINLQQYQYSSVRVCYRGVSYDYLSSRLTKNGSDILESELLKRLFYFGDKSKHYFHENSRLHTSKYLKNINDISESSNNEIFSKLKKLSSSKNPTIIDFINDNKSFFDFFNNPANKPTFVKAISDFGTELRDYYLKILHAAGNIGISDKSTLISTSRSYKVAHQFAQGDRGYIIIYIARGKSRTKDKNRNNSFAIGLPYLNKHNSIFPEQEEVTLRGALFAHDMLGVIHPKDQILTVNPHFFSDSNIGIDLSKHSLTIDQSNFNEDLKQLTSYTRWLCTYNYDEFYHGGENA